MFKGVRAPLGSIVLATVATGAGVALAAVHLPQVNRPAAVVQPQPVQGDVSALGQRAGWNADASVDSRQATPAYVGVDTTSSQPLLNGEQGATAGLGGVSVDGVSVELTPLFTLVHNELIAVLNLEHRTVSSAITLAQNVAHGALSTATSATHTAITLATQPIAADAGMAGQSASVNRDGTTAGTGTSGVSPTAIGVAINGGAVSADAAAAGAGIGGSVHLPLR